MAVAASLLQRAGLAFQPCPDFDTLTAQAVREFGALLIEEECLTARRIEKLNGFLDEQPAWSDLPVLLLVKRVARSELGKPWALRIHKPIVIERPIISAALVSVLQMAIRARQRQYEVRDLIASLREANQSLEQRVNERTAQLARTMEELTRSNNELERFASIASHDLQEPLRMVKGFVDLLAERYTDALDDKAKEYIGFAVDGASRMSILINDLLTFSRAGGQELVLAPTRLEALLDTVLINMKVALGESGAVITHDPLPTVTVGAGQITQVIQNLISNAIKFRTPDRPCRIHVSAKEDGNDWVFSIRDNGIGIDPQFKDKIFVIFERLHGRDEYAGTGIGLAICKKIVERHGGRIWIESEPGKGTTFFFTIPKATPIGLVNGTPCC
jgi:signal transduction histidine kinase